MTEPTTYGTCPECGSDLVLREGKFGEFIGGAPQDRRVAMKTSNGRATVPWPTLAGPGSADIWWTYHPGAPATRDNPGEPGSFEVPEVRDPAGEPVDLATLPENLLDGWAMMIQLEKEREAR